MYSEMFLNCWTFIFPKMSLESPIPNPLKGVRGEPPQPRPTGRAFRCGRPEAKTSGLNAWRGLSAGTGAKRKSNHPLDGKLGGSRCPLGGGTRTFRRWPVGVSRAWSGRRGPARGGPRRRGGGRDGARRRTCSARQCQSVARRQRLAVVRSDNCRRRRHRRRNVS